ncbi:unnamed protein product [Acanthoscelides obtectus]|uniref:BED-type domain-containing protein n=1 Tax=Acanthoscelides obtectus TaxID=200917 RepID=A0A9P0LGU6_ACAOB|nr:unnamed protein product [Acanthoscelides obtectus]CAK1680611.1 hypothetical protein AOBTE_LOCUS32803 [Acanthoscelides obtectus]
MSSKKSQVWTHFSEETGNKVKCLYCGQLLSVKNKSTSTLIRHIKLKHPTQPMIRHMVADEHPVEGGSSAVSQQLPQPREAPSTSSISGTKQPQASTFSRASKNPTITSYFHKPLTIISKQKEIDRQLICMITKEYHPFSIVEDKEFKHLLYLLNPNYKLPTRKTVSKSMIPAIYNETIDLVKRRLDRAFAVCLTTDGWTSRTNDSFYSVTAHYIAETENNILLSSDLLGCIYYRERHTAENISSKLRELIDDWQLTNKVAAIISDNAANIKATIRIGGWRFWGCFAHSLNLVTRSGLNEIKEVVDKIKNISSYFKRSSHAYSQLKASAERMDIPPLKLINDVATRWNSTYDMINRVLQMKNAIISTLSILNTSRRNEQDESEIDQLDNEEWLIAEQAIKVLDIFYLVTMAISSEKHVSASPIIFYYKQITKHLNSINLDTIMPQIENMIKKT